MPGYKVSSDLDFSNHSVQSNEKHSHAFPVSLIRYWVLQVIFISSLVYMGHAIYQLRALEKERHCKRVALQWELELTEAKELGPCIGGGWSGSCGSWSRGS